MAGFPDYQRPPVVEVAIGVQFAPLSAFNAAHVGLFWNCIRKDFGRVEDQVALPHLVEQDQEPQQEFQLRMQTGPALPRTWLVNSDGNRIVQIQRDRFLHNWRKMSDKDDYPRFDAVEEDFLRYWEVFKDFLKQEKIGSPQIDQYEVTYVNYVTKDNGWKKMDDLFKIFTLLQWKTRSGFLREPESFHWSATFPLPDKKGRLYVDMAPVFVKPENERVLRLVLNARGKQKSDNSDSDMKEWFDVGHEQIVKGFADLVTEVTDSWWGKKP